MNLDEKNRKLLSIIDLDARKPLVKIAKEVGISKELAKYRLEKLQKIGLIKGYKAVINPFILKNHSFHIFLSLTNKELQKRLELQKEFMKFKGIKRVLHTYGKWDFIITFHSPSILKFKEAYEELIERYEDMITNKKLSIVTSTTILPRRIIYDLENLRKIDFCLTEKSYDINEKELSIINELSKNGRATFIEISKKVGLVHSTVKKIIEKLEKEGVIAGYYSLIDHEIMGLDHYKILISLNNIKERKKIKDYLELQKEVIQIQLPLGTPDIEMELLVESLEHLEKFLGKLTSYTQAVRGLEIIPIMSEERAFFD